MVSVALAAGESAGYVSPWKPHHWRAPLNHWEEKAGREEEAGREDEAGKEEEAGREEEGRQKGICSFISALNPSPPLHSFIFGPLTTEMRLSTHLLTELLYSMIIGSRGQSSGSRGPQ